MSTSGGNAFAKFVALLGLLVIVDMFGRTVSARNAEWSARITGRGVSASSVAARSLPMTLHTLGFKVSVADAERSASTVGKRVASARSVAPERRGMIERVRAWSCRVREKRAMQEM